MKTNPVSHAISRFLAVLAFLASFLLPVTSLQADLVFFSDKDTRTIHRMNLDGSGFTTILSAPTLQDPRGLAVDPFTQTLYFADSDTHSIRSANFDGSNVQTLYSGLSTPSDVEIDLTNGHLYWADRNSGEIKRGDLAGATPAVTVLRMSSTEPYYLDLDIPNGHIYWAENDQSVIRRTNFDGAGTVFAVTSGDRIRDLVVDAPNNHIYWNDRDDSELYLSELNTGDFLGSVYSDGDGLGTPHGLALDNMNGWLYWTDTGANAGVFRAPANGTGPIQTLNAIGRDGPWDIELVITNPIPEPASLTLTTLVLLMLATRPQKTPTQHLEFSR